MGIEENKVIMQRYIDELLNKRDYSKANEILHQDFTAVGGGGAKGIEGHRKYTEYMRSISSNIHREILQMIAEGDMIAVFCQNTGTHDGDGLGFIPTGNQFSFENVAVYEFKDGKIINGAVRAFQNLLSTYQQIGVLPSTEELIKSYNDSLK